VIWDYRVVRRKVGNGEIFQIHRVFYKDEAKTLALYIENLPANIIGLKAQPMLSDILLMTNAFDNPTLYIPEWNT